MPPIKRLTIVTGHYGCGKTNLSLNLALDAASTGERVTLVDLDVVNPYFRSSDHGPMLAERGVKLIAPNFAGTTLDTPSLPAAVSSAFGAEGLVIFDVGGDDAGATALGRYAGDVGALDYDLLYVVNRYRNLTSTAEEAAALLGEIESASHLKATGVVNNSHLAKDTTVATVLDSLEFADAAARQLGLPLRFTTVPRALASEFGSTPGDATFVPNPYPVNVYVRAPWDEAPGTDEEV
ncbi:MAG: ParA family protein [Actinobacteria bacterium]|nr:MAG: ParA family protein [Actinomycetota bacterium]